MENLSTVIERLNSFKVEFVRAIHFDICGLEKNYKELEKDTLKENFWNDTKSANEIFAR